MVNEYYPKNGWRAHYRKVTVIKKIKSALMAFAAFSIYAAASNFHRYILKRRRNMENETRPKIKGVLLDVEKNEAKAVEFVSTLDNYYEMLHCDMIEYASRHIGPKRGCREFDIVCDEEGTFKESPKISAIDNLGKPMLVGSIMIVGLPDNEGNETSLTDDDCNFILARIVTISTMKYPLGYKMLTQCDY